MSAQIASSCCELSYIDGESLKGTHMKDEANSILQLIRSGTASMPISGKVGQRLLQPKIAQVLSASGYDVDVEDTRGFFPPGLPAWRDKQTFEVVPTSGRRRIDLVVRKNEEVVALIEAESDLNDLREHGVSGRSGHYDVFSIASQADGTWFDSYKSLERLAAAAWYAEGGFDCTVHRGKIRQRDVYAKRMDEGGRGWGAILCVSCQF